MLISVLIVKNSKWQYLEHYGTGTKSNKLTEYNRKFRKRLNNIQKIQFMTKVYFKSFWKENYSIDK